jgi:hypothetical protein
MHEIAVPASENCIFDFVYTISGDHGHGTIVWALSLLSSERP